MIDLGLQLIALAIAASQILRLGFTAAAYSDEDSADDCARFCVARGVELPEKTSSAPFVVLPKEAHLQRTRSNGKFQRLCTTKSYSLARSTRWSHRSSARYQVPARATQSPR